MNFSLAGINLNSPIINTPIPKAWSADDLKNLGQTNLGLVMTKSVTLAARGGNIDKVGLENCHYYDDNMSLNAIGLANDGLAAHLDYIREAKKTFDQPVMVSVSGFSVEEYVTMVKQIQDVEEVSFIELNLSCPNTDKRYFADTPELVDELLSRLQNLRNKKIGVKVPPSADRSQIEELCDTFVNYKVDFITCTNTLGNCFLFNKDGEPLIKANNGFGGMAGKALKPYALATLIRYREALKKLNADIDLIGSGGVASGQDIADYLRAGASAVGIASQIMHEGFGAVDRIYDEWKKM
jgi:dihydroorotate dehydrogenase (fumarate)